MLNIASFSAGHSVILILILFLIFCITYSCSQNSSEYITGGNSIQNTHKFVGNQTCQSCHATEWEEWKGSHHDYSIGEADKEHVRGDFENAKFVDGNESYHFFQQDNLYYVEISTSGKEAETHKIEYTFGWEPLQQYLVDVGQGKLQALHVAWDTEKGTWYSLYPYEDFDDDDWMHWSGGAMNWNTMCADCHSTNLQQNYIAEADSFHTKWSVLNVSCEACHGPGGDHVEFVSSEEGQEASRERIRKDINLGRFTSQIDEINTCAPCHSHRQKLTDNYIHGDPYLDHFDPTLPHPDNYFADGQILEEVFVYGSFLQSKMYTMGVSCTDCHNPHSLELRQPLTNNKLCMSCHEPEYNTVEHHFHEPNTESSQCINCHMPGRMYMGVDFRRDHSFRVPRPDHSVKHATPNACNDCHSDRSPDWAAIAVEEWYGNERPDHYSNTLLKANADEPDAIVKLRDLINDPDQPEIIRATGVWYLGRYPEEDSFEILNEAINSDSPMVRNSAAKAIENLPVNMRLPLLENALNDSVRAVRVSAAQQLREFTIDNIPLGSREYFENAMEDYRKYLDVNQYFPQGQMNRALYFEGLGETEKAIEAYKYTLERDTYFNPARVNLAYLYNRQGKNDRAEELLNIVIVQEPEFGDAYYSKALLLAEDNRLDEAVYYFEKAAELLENNSRVFYNLAIANQTLGLPDSAEQAYMRAIELDTQNGDYRYGLITLYMQKNQLDKAYEEVRELDQLYPNNQQIEQLMQRILQQKQ